jgi:hypothetical protein
MKQDPADTLANLVRKIIQGRRDGPLNPSFRVALIKALAEYDDTTRSRLLDDDMAGERLTPEGHYRCPECGKPFVPQRVTQTYCLPTCRTKAGNRRNNARRPKGAGRTLDPRK